MLTLRYRAFLIVFLILNASCAIGSRAPSSTYVNLGKAPTTYQAICDNLVAKVLTRDSLRGRDVSKFTRGHTKFRQITLADNKKLIAFLNEEKEFKNTVAFHTSNRYFKSFNDVDIKDKSVTYPTSVIYFQYFMKNLEMYPELKTRFKYADWKSMNFFFMKNGLSKDDIFNRLLFIGRKTDKDYSKHIKNSSLKDRFKEIIEKHGDPMYWFTKGEGANVDEAATIARLRSSLEERGIYSEIYRFSNHIELLKDVLLELENTRLMLQNNMIHVESFLTEVPGSGGQYVLSEYVIDMVKKHNLYSSTPDSVLIKDLNRAFKLQGNSKLDASDLELIKRNVAAADVYAATVLQEETKIFDFSKSTFGGVSVDRERLGALGLSKTMGYLVGVDAPSHAVVLAREAFFEVSNTLKHEFSMMRTILNKVQEVLFQLNILESGDEFLWFTKSILSKANKKKIIKELAKSDFAGNMRLVFFPRKYSDIMRNINAVVHSAIIIDAEKCLKYLRRELVYKYGFNVAESVAMGINVKISSKGQIVYDLMQSRSGVLGLNYFLHDRITEYLVKSTKVRTTIRATII